MKQWNEIINDVKFKIGNHDLEALSGGLRNTCYKYPINNDALFIKIYNKNTKYAYHLSKTRCESEFNMCNYLYENGCNVPKALYYDENENMAIFNYRKLQ